MSKIYIVHRKDLFIGFTTDKETLSTFMSTHPIKDLTHMKVKELPHNISPNDGGLIDHEICPVYDETGEYLVTTNEILNFALDEIDDVIEKVIELNQFIVDSQELLNLNEREDTIMKTFRETHLDEVIAQHFNYLDGENYDSYISYSEVIERLVCPRIKQYINLRR